MKLLRWLSFVWHWFLELQHAWIGALVIIVACLVAFHRGADEATVRITGLVLQILGIGTVAWGIHETRTFFGHPSVLSILRGWLSRFPPLGGRVITASANIAVMSLTGKARGFASASASLNASVEERMSALEENLRRVHDRISQIQNEMDQEFRKLAEGLSQEKSLRMRDEQEILKKLEGTATGGLHISAIGVSWLLVGVTMSTIPSELCRWLK